MARFAWSILKESKHLFRTFLFGTYLFFLASFYCALFLYLYVMHSDEYLMLATRWNSWFFWFHMLEHFHKVLYVLHFIYNISRKQVNVNLSLSEIVTYTVKGWQKGFVCTSPVIFSTSDGSNPAYFLKFIFLRGPYFVSLWWFFLADQSLSCNFPHKY